MHFSWLMHLFIVLLFSRFSSGEDVYPHYNSDEDESTTKSLFKVDENDELTKTTTHDALAHDDDHVEYDHSHEDEEDNSTTTFSSSSAKVRTTDAITKTSTTTRTTRLIWSTTKYYFHEFKLITTTLDAQLIAFYLAKANRERLLLKIFTIMVSIGMSILAVALFTIHLLRKSKRYRGYRAPAGTLSNKPSV